LVVVKMAALVDGGENLREVQSRRFRRMLVLMTGEQYKKSLLDGRIVYFEGVQVDSLLNHPVLGDCVNRVADEYDRLWQPGTMSRFLLKFSGGHSVFRLLPDRTLRV
jgi:hypothetical protein